jgi:hypothetical protein
MTHEELIFAIKDDIDLYTDNCFSKALLAVVELHKPVESEYFDNPVCAACSPDIDTWFDYPCQTIQAIEKEMNEDLQDMWPNLPSG